MRYAGLTALAAFSVFPLLWLLSIAVRATGGVFGFPPELLPWPPTAANFVTVWETMPLPRFFANTVLLCGAAVALNVVLCAMAAYPLARIEFPGRKLVAALLLSTLMLPGHVGMIVNFVTLLRLGLVDTYAGVLLPGAVSVFGIFLLRQAFLTVPAELEDAARLDGASEWAIWWRVMLPVVAPALAVPPCGAYLRTDPPVRETACIDQGSFCNGYWYPWYYFAKQYTPVQYANGTKYTNFQGPNWQGTCCHRFSSSMTYS
ncbi:MAG: carbohydrate ABC transporter permease, partial [Bryobacteraceae bacterium]|nr:carbohydrate ABC transporter permease [Bryobacteraceae bacterium]